MSWLALLPWAVLVGHTIAKAALPLRVVRI